MGRPAGPAFQGGHAGGKGKPMTTTLDGLSPFRGSAPGLRSKVTERMTLVGGPALAIYAWQRSDYVIAVVAATATGVVETTVTVQIPPGTLNTVQTPWSVVVAQVADEFKIATGETMLELRLSGHGEPETIPFVEPDGDAWWDLVKEVRGKTTS